MRLLQQQLLQWLAKELAQALLLLVAVVLVAAQVLPARAADAAVWQLLMQRMLRHPRQVMKPQ
jgi:hypothetical protein